MKPRVFIYDVPIKSHLTLSMPRRSKILSFQEQHGKPMLWALVDPDEGMIDCDFRLAGNGHPIEENENELHYRGTVQLNDGALVLHLFEVIRFSSSATDGPRHSPSPRPSAPKIEP